MARSRRPPENDAVRQRIRRDGHPRPHGVENLVAGDDGITQGTVDKDDPTTRGAHTHHISMTDGVLTLDWPARCPQFSPAVKEGHFGKQAIHGVVLRCTGRLLRPSSDCTLEE